MLRPFEMHRPATLEEAVRLHSHLGDSAAYYAGGTELLLAIKEGIAQYDHLIDLKGITALRGIERLARGGRTLLRVGALMCHAEVAADSSVRASLPALAEMAQEIGNVRVRNAGTIGGNLAFAEPHSDVGALLLALGAEIEAMGENGARRIPAEEFWLGPFETVLAPHEIAVAVEIPLEPGARAAYAKFALREFPTAGIGALFHTADRSRIDWAKIAVGAVNGMPTRLRQAEQWVRGMDLADPRLTDPEAWSEAAGPFLEPFDDIYGSADYKVHLVGVLAVRVASTLCAQLGAADKEVS